MQEVRESESGCVGMYSGTQLLGEEVLDNKVAIWSTLLLDTSPWTVKS